MSCSFSIEKYIKITFDFKNSTYFNFTHSLKYYIALDEEHRKSISDKLNGTLKIN